MLFMSFAVFAFAAPPPDLVPDIVTDQSAFVVQDNQTVTDYTFEVQEVAFVDIGNIESEICFSEYSEQVKDVELPAAMVINICFNRSSQLNKPPSVNTNKQVTNFQMNLQNSNYGYPFTGDNC